MGILTSIHTKRTEVVIITGLVWCQVDQEFYKDPCRDLLTQTKYSEAGFRFLAQPQVGKLVVACLWSAVYSTEL